MVLGVCAIAGLGVAGLLIGQERAPDAKDARAARRASYAEAFQAGQAQARQRSFHAGHRQGAKRGRSAGRQSGSQDGERVGTKAASVRSAALAPPPAATPAPGTPGSTVCVKYQDYVPGVGCVPPVAPGQTEAPVNCPPGQVPVGTTGACGKP